MKIVLKILASLIGHTLYLVGSTCFSLAILPFVMVCKRIGNYKLPASLLHYSLAFFIRKVLTTLRVIEIKEVKGLEGVPLQTPNVYVCNHRGKLDGPLLMSYINYIKPTMKSKYAKLLIYRIFVKWFDFCEIDVQSADGLIRTEKKCSEILRNQSILFFPEGTRKSGDRLTDFKKMAFSVAVNNGVPVVPVLLYNDAPFMTKQFSSFFPLERVKYKIHFLEPVYPEGKTVNELTNEVYRIMSAELLKMSQE